MNADMMVFWSSVATTIASIDWSYTLSAIVTVCLVVGVLTACAIGAAQWGLREDEE